MAEGQFLYFYEIVIVKLQHYEKSTEHHRF